MPYNGHYEKERDRSRTERRRVGTVSDDPMVRGVRLDDAPALDVSAMRLL